LREGGSPEALACYRKTGDSVGPNCRNKLMRYIAWWLVTTFVLLGRAEAQTPSDQLWPPGHEPSQQDPPVQPVQPEPATPTAPDPVPQETDSEPIAPSIPEPTAIEKVQIHGFISEGAFWSTSNNYIGYSDRGSVKLFEGGLNISTEVTDRLRAGAQLFTRDVGTIELPPRFDWMFFDYSWRSWLGLRAGIIKMPFGLYNEYQDIPSARTFVLLPQSIYSFTNRDVLLSHRGFALYGTRRLGDSGELEYQAWLGTLNIPSSALQLAGTRLDKVDTKYITGVQVFWTTPLEGLRVGGTYLRGSIDFNFTLDDATTAALVMAGTVPPEFDGKLTLGQRPFTWVVGSVEYTHDEWLLAAEYSRALAHAVSNLPGVLASFDTDEERFYAMSSYRASPRWELGTYYSARHVDAHDRIGHDSMRFPRRSAAWQRDAALALRLDINDRWLWKLEGHFIDGTADLSAALNKNPDRYWGLFLVRTSVTF